MGVGEDLMKPASPPAAHPRLGSTAAVVSALDRLGSAANAAGKGWQPMLWRHVDETGEERPLAGLRNLDFARGEPLTIRTRLQIPEILAGVPTAGDALSLVITSLYPLSVTIDGRELLHEPTPTVATGPAQIEFTDRLAPGWSAEMEVRVRPYAGHGGTDGGWLEFNFSTIGVQQRFDRLDLAWAQIALADEIASSNEERALVADAAAEVPDNPLDCSPEELATALDAIGATLEPLSAKVADIDVHIVGHTHLDLAWLWTWEDTVEVIKRDARTVLRMMDDYPEMTFTFSQPPAYEVIRLHEPELFAQIVEHVGTGRWEPATMQWVEGDTNIVSGESLATQLRLGVRYTREHLKRQPVVFHAPDTFGHSANMPQLVAQAGGRIYYHQRANPGTPGGRRWPAYWWEGIDGTRILACSTDSHGESLTAGAVARAAIEALRAGLPAGLLIVGVGDHGGGPTRRGYDTLRALHGEPAMPHMRCSTLEAYADAVIASGADLPVHVGESATVFEGCYTTHLDVKQANREGERLIDAAQALLALAGLAKDTDLEAVVADHAFHQFHDILDGSAIAEAYVKTRLDHERLVEITGRAIDDSIARLAAGAQPGAICVANQHGHDVTDAVSVPYDGPAGVVRLSDRAGQQVIGQRIDGVLTFVARVPGYRVATFVVADSADVLANADIGGLGAVERASDGRQNWLVETKHLSAVVDGASGTITSLVDKRSGIELVGFGVPKTWEYGGAVRTDLALNVFQVLEERAHLMTSWHIAEVQTETSLLSSATTELMENGPVRSVLRVTHRFRSSTIVEDITFYRDLPRIDLAIQLDWQEEARDGLGTPNLKLSFASGVDVSDAWFSVPFGAVRRPANGQEVPALSWVATKGATAGIALFNDSNHGHDVLGGRARVTLIRTASDPDPRSDRGRFALRIGLLPFSGDWRAAEIPRAGRVFDRPLIARVLASETKRSVTSNLAHWRPTISSSGDVSVSLRRQEGGVAILLAETSGAGAVVTIAGIPEFDVRLAGRPN